MFSEEILKLGTKKSTIREIFEYGKKRAAVVGKENIFDFSIGNPNVPAPECVKEAILDIVNNEDPTLIHGYTSAQGDDKVRESIAKSLNDRFNTSFTKDNLYMTVGAAASISICLKALTNVGNEYITFAPYFPEYKCFVEGAGGKLNVVPADIKTFQINFEEFEKLINENTKAVIVNSPNNPSGVVYSEDTINKLSKILGEKSKEYNHPIYLIADEPYREIAYDGVNVPYLTKYYNNTFVCYSYSKSLSLPGERIGYIVVPSEMDDFNLAYAAICGGGRVLGYVNAPSLFQKVVAKCADATSDISIYKTNRNLLYDGLTKLGFKCVKPEGAFYLFPQSLESDAKEFCKKAREKYDLLLVPGDDFGCPGHFRLSYCVQTEQIERAMPLFEKLAKDYLE
ncbi:pyridoxal phosphate-dependent aminotransferase [Clostridium bornimense]|uniref:pyridoxal phosphate-dependent aminotransferase n=1 Tax=Clostridium bornimense TaxID=1216932 RepID=UPI001C1073E8|nr:pyridoxal phosphate-dependent aminotransferase [Clostridium bornimense]MBU5316969.1 pyridoxal phosphate-dependent aminotransferase [Clostridium bornimense]